MKRMTKAASMLGAAAVALSLTACGGDSGSGYCDLLESDEFTSIPDQTDAAAMADFGDSVQEVADAAPDEVKEDWQSMSDMFSTLSDIDTSDPEAMTEQMAEFEDMQSVVERVNENVESECDVEVPAL